MDFFLAGDLGGTKTVLALYGAEHGGNCGLLRLQRYASGEHENFSALLTEFLKGCPEVPSLAVLGVAGPVVEGRARLTNLGWVIDREELRWEFGFAEVLLLNDLVAVARSVPVLSPEEYFVVNEGHAAPHGSMAVIAPGTGLGQAFLCWCGSGYRAFPSEGGHSDFAPLDRAEMELLSFLQKRRTHVSYESVCSGLGIPNIFSYLCEAAGMEAGPALRADLASAHDPTPVLLAHALKNDCPPARRSVEMFLSILAAEAGNMALKFMATGGVILGGGILPRLLPMFSRQRFLERFQGKGRMSGVLAAMPVKIILHENAALMGTVAAARERMREREE